jgi:hypothetical protein
MSKPAMMHGSSCAHSPATVRSSSSTAWNCCWNSSHCSGLMVTWSADASEGKPACDCSACGGGRGQGGGPSAAEAWWQCWWREAAPHPQPTRCVVPPPPPPQPTQWQAPPAAGPWPHGTTTGPQARRAPDRRAGSRGPATGAGPAPGAHQQVQDGEPARQAGRLVLLQDRLLQRHARARRAPAAHRAQAARRHCVQRHCVQLACVERPVHRAWGWVGGLGVGVGLGWGVGGCRRRHAERRWGRAEHPGRRGTPGARWPSAARTGAGASATSKAGALVCV